MTALSPESRWSTWRRRLPTALLLLLLSAGLVNAIVDWRQSVDDLVDDLIVALFISIMIPSLLYLPCFCFFYVQTRSLRESRRKTWEMCMQAVGEILGQIS